LVRDDLGTIRLVVHDARVTTGVFTNSVLTSQDRLPSSSSSSSLNQDSKFWKQPSVVTSGGRKIQNEKEKFIPLTRWENCSSEPMKIITLHYHSEDVIRYLKNPAAQQEKEREKEKQKEKKRKREEEEAEMTRLRQMEEHHGNGEVEEIIKEKEVPFLDLEEDTPSWKVIKLKR
jgi:flagellar biosynthesis GTPase FlhF